jgi:hypothetical protein
LLQLYWYKNAGNEWCRLEEAELAGVDQYGVFVVWRAGDPGRPSAVLYVGRGHLRTGIADCRRNPAMVGSRGLHVTWAKVDPRDVDAVAGYLYQQLRPLWGEAVPVAVAQPVNLPLTA